MEMCKQVRKHRYTFTILISSWRCKHSLTRVPTCHQASSAKNTDILVSGLVVKSHTWQRMGKGFCARQNMSFLLLSQDCRQARAHVRLLHRSRRTDRVPLRVQQHYEVTILTLGHRETEAILPESQTKMKKLRRTIKQREIDGGTSQSG